MEIPFKELLLDKVSFNNNQLIPEKVNNVLIYYDKPKFYLGDALIAIDKFKCVKLICVNATITISFVGSTAYGKHKILLKNNPYIQNSDNNSAESIEFDDFDLIISMTNNENRLANVIEKKYKNSLIEFKAAIYSFSKGSIAFTKNLTIVFPESDYFLSEVERLSDPKELYLSEKEIDWGDSWLGGKGLLNEEGLVIMLDSTSTRSKLLNMGEYSKLLLWLLKLPKIKILIFDEKSIGKRIFYKELLGEESLKKFIFSESLNLREDLSLIGSRKTKLIIGPCTGLMHCATGIFNYLHNQGISLNKIPKMVTYTGQYFFSAYYWWRNSPLVDVLILQGTPQNREMIMLEDVPVERRMETKNLLECKYYTAEMIIGHIKKIYSPVI